MDDVIIVGASLAGLLTGAILINRGYRVRMLERRPLIGGRVRATEHKGFTVDNGLFLSRFGGHGALARAVRATGIAWKFRAAGGPYVYQDFSFLPFPGRTLDIVKSELLPKGDRLKLLTLLMRMTTLKPAQYLDVSLDQWLKRHKVSLTLYQFLETFSAFGLVCPDIHHVSAGEFFYFLQQWAAHPNFGYPGAGIPALTGALSYRIQQNGQVQLNTTVERLLLTSGLVTGLQTVASERYYARAYVLAVPPDPMLQIVDPLALSEREREAAKRMVPTAGILWQIGTKTLVSNVRNPIVTSMPPSIGAFISNLEPAVAPAGKQLATWFYPIPRERLADAAYIDQETRWLKATVEEMFPRLRPNRLWERVLVQQRVDTAQLQTSQARNHRLPQQLARLSNLFLVGDFVDTGGVGQDIACQSAIEGADLVDQYLGSRQ